MPGTRSIILQQIAGWRKAASSTNCFWTHGTAGTRKSTITHAICDQCRKEDVLAGSFLGKRDVPEQRDPLRVLPSLAYMLAIVVEPYRELVLRAIENEPDISSISLNLQLNTLFVIPFTALREQGYSGHSLLFAIDALDECGDSIGLEQR